MTDPICKAELINDAFSYGFTHESNSCSYILSFVAEDTHLSSSIMFTPSLIGKNISRLKTKSMGGPDNLPPIFFKKCSLRFC